MEFLSWPFKKVNFQHGLCGSLLILKHSFQLTKPFFLKRWERGFAIISTNWFMPCHNETIIYSSHISDWHCCFITRCVKSVHDQPSLVLHSQTLFFPSPSSSFTFSSVSPYPFSTLCHRQSYNNLMFEWGRNIEFSYSCLMYLTFEIILLSVISESWINMNTTTTQKITIFFFNRNLYLVRVFFNLACLWNRDFLKELSVGNIYNRSLADALTL